jgi:hypothetical protein
MTYRGDVVMKRGQENRNARERWKCVFLGKTTPGNRMFGMGIYRLTDSRRVGNCVIQEELSVWFRRWFFGKESVKQEKRRNACQLSEGWNTWRGVNRAE